WRSNPDEHLRSTDPCDGAAMTAAQRHVTPDAERRRTKLRRLGLIVACAAVILMGGVLAFSFKTLPSLEGRSITHAFTDTADTSIGRVVAPETLQHPEHSGVIALGNGRDAFAARAHLADAAERSIDLE